MGGFVFDFLRTSVCLGIYQSNLNPIDLQIMTSSGLHDLSRTSNSSSFVYYLMSAVDDECSLVGTPCGCCTIS